MLSFLGLLSGSSNSERKYGTMPLMIAKLVSDLVHISRLVLFNCCSSDRKPAGAVEFILCIFLRFGVPCSLKRVCLRKSCERLGSSSALSL